MYEGYRPAVAWIGLKSFAAPSTAMDPIVATLPSLTDSCATLSLIDADIVAKYLHVPISRKSVAVNGLGSNRTVGLVVMSFVILAQQGDDPRPVIMHFKHEFHIVNGFAPGLILGLDFLHPHRMKVDLAGARVTMPDDYWFVVQCLEATGLNSKHIDNVYRTTRQLTNSMAPEIPEHRQGEQSGPDNAAPSGAPVLVADGRTAGGGQTSSHDKRTTVEDVPEPPQTPPRRPSSRDKRTTVEDVPEPPQVRPQRPRRPRSKNKARASAWTASAETPPAPSKPREYALICKTSQVVPPRSEAFVPVRWDVTPPKGKPLFASRAAWVDEAQNQCFVISAALVDQDTSVLTVLNPGDKEVIVPSHMPLTEATDDVTAIRHGGPRKQFTTGPSKWSSKRKRAASESSEPGTKPPPATAKKSGTKPSTPTAAGTDAKAFVAEAAFAGDDSRPPDLRKAAAEESSIKVDDIFHIGVPSGHTEPPPSIVALLREFKDCFSLDGAPGKVQGPQFEIQLEEGATLHPEAPRRVSPEKREVIDATIDQLLEWGVIEPSNSRTSYPVLLVRQGEKWRFCVDYRGLNKMTVTDKYPLPRADDIFEALAGASYYSILDAVKGYHQLEVHPDDRFKTAFTCHRGLFHYTRIPFGLKNAPAFFQRFMDSVLGSLRWNCAMVYIDDIVIYTADLEQHESALRTLLEATRSVGLRYDPKKCHFALSSLKLLGRHISTQGVSVLPDRALAIKELSGPLDTVEKVQRFLGLMNFYRQFIPRFAQVAAPLQEAIKGMRYEPSNKGGADLVLPSGERTKASKVPVEWTEARQKSFIALKEALARATTLAYPDFLKRYFLYVDSSQEGFAVALHQQHVRELPPLKDEADGIVMAAIAGVDLDDGWLEQLKQHQREDPTWTTIIGRLREDVPVQGYALVNDILVRTSDDRICLPKALFRRALDEAHQGHYGVRTTQRNLEARFWHPRIAETIRSYVKHCPVCVRTRVLRRTGHASEGQIEHIGVPYHTISVDLIMGLPSVNGIEACLILVCCFTKAVQLRPMPAPVTAMDVAHAIEDMVVRNGWQPKRLISDHDHLIIGDVGRRLAERLGMTLTPTAPYHHQANPSERYVKTVECVLRALCLDKPPTAWLDHVGAAELTINSTINSVTGYAPFDLLYIHRPHLLQRLQEHQGVGAIEEQWSFSAARVQQAAQAVRKATLEQHGRYNRTRAPLPALTAGDKVMVRIKDRPLKASRLNTKIDPELQGPFKVKEVLSDHRVLIDLPASMEVEPLFDASQLQIVPEDDADGRPGLPAATDDTDGKWEPQFILKERMFNNRHKQYLVKWRDSGIHEWMFESDLLEDGCADLINEWQEQQEGMGTPPLDSRRAAQAHVVMAKRPSPSENDPHIAGISDAPGCDSALDALTRPVHRPQIVIRDGRRFLITERPVAFSSKATVGNEKKLVALELEAEGLLWAFNKLPHLLKGAQITVVTDHQPLGPVLTAPSHQEYSERLNRIRAALAPYIHNFVFVYKKGITHVNVDALSRLPTTSTAATGL